jgi:hypothetical protein
MCRTFPPFRLQPPAVASGAWSGFDPEPTARPAGHIPSWDQGVIGASPPLGGWPRQPAESSSSSYGPAVHLQLLSTPSHEDAVTFDFNVQTQLDKDFHLADSTHLQAHECGDSSPLSVKFDVCAAAGPEESGDEWPHSMAGSSPSRPVGRRGKVGAVRASRANRLSYGPRWPFLAAGIVAKSTGKPVVCNRRHRRNPSY